MYTPVYSDYQSATHWSGMSFSDTKDFQVFLANEVAPRLHDASGKADFTAHLSSLASTGFAQNSLQAILAAEQPEERDWAVGEALAEAWLAREHGVIWPWNMERDKRTPKASLPGADLVGFVTQGSETRLALGEVKSSSDSHAPPNVMRGRHGMAGQLENLATDLGLLHSLIRWLQPRCRGNNAEPHFNAAIAVLLRSGNKALALFGVLVRDTRSDERDLRSRGQHLGGIVQPPTTCRLMALYLPFPISSLPERVAAGGAP